ncbi:DMT family transporter [Lysinibacillus pakistanensis]|uniref:DMT family transporter n=1 Tax=Lysinibacillus pakistanensis TaxID=759811 RepID=UPI0034E3B3F5
MNTQMWASGRVILAMTIVGSSIVAGKIIIQSFPVFLANELRFLVASAALVPLWMKVEGFSVLDRKDYLSIFLQALFGVFLFNLLMLSGLSQTSAIEAGIITSTLPACTAILSVFLLKENFTRNIGLGVLMAVFGTVLINITSISTIDLTSLAGNLLILGAICCESLFIILGKSHSKRVSALTVATMVSCFGAVLFFPFAIAESRSFAFKEVTFAEWGLVIYFGIIVTVLAFILMQQGLARISATSVGILTSFLPISSIMLSSLFLDEKISFLQCGGFVFILGALYLLSKPSTQIG